MNKSRISIFWFRRDLRLHDNNGLYKALTTSDNILPIFIFDTDILDGLKDKADRRVTFIHDMLSEISSTLQSSGSSLYVLHAKPSEAFEKLSREFAIKAVYTNHDYEPYAISRDTEIEKYLDKKGIAFYSFAIGNLSSILSNLDKGTSILQVINIYK